MANSDDIFDAIEQYGELSEKQVIALRTALKKEILKKVDEGKKPYVAAVLAGQVTDRSFKKISDIFGKGFEETLSNIQKTLVEFDVKLNKTDLANIAKMKDTFLEQVNVPSSKMKSDLKAALLKNIGKGMAKEEIIDELERLYPAMGGQIKTLVNTSLQHFYKSTTWEKTSNQFEYFRYVGPLDKVTRAFCREHVNKVYTKEEAAKIQDIILGFYNCRHDLIGITKTEYNDEEPGTVDESLA